MLSDSKIIYYLPMFAMLSSQMTIVGVTIIQNMKGRLMLPGHGDRKSVDIDDFQGCLLNLKSESIS
jgi:hypothetical protein